MKNRDETDYTTLEETNVAIGLHENNAERASLESLLAPVLAFQRADCQRTLDDRAAFLSKLAPGGDRATWVLDPIEIYGRRAIVKCIVKSGDNYYHNIRLFIKRSDGWKLLGWANEPCEDLPKRVYVGIHDKEIVM